MGCSPIHTMINEIEECRSLIGHHQTANIVREIVGARRIIKKRTVKTPSLLPKKNTKKKVKLDAGIHKKHTIQPSSDMVEKMNRIAQLFKGSLPVHFFSKIITDSDTKQHHNRLLLPAKTKGLKDKLKRTLKNMGTELNIDVEEDMELPVKVVDGFTNIYNMNFRYLKSNGSYRIIGKDYTKFVQTNNLKSHVDIVHVWVFHVGYGAEREFWLGLIKEEPTVNAAPLRSVHMMNNVGVVQKIEENMALAEATPLRSLLMIDHVTAEEKMKEREDAEGVLSSSWRNLPLKKRIMYLWRCL